MSKKIKNRVQIPVIVLNKNTSGIALEPDRWVVIDIGDLFYKVFATFSNEYEDRWRINSGISDVKEDDDFYYIHGASGSVYKCEKYKYGLDLYGAGVLDNIINSSPIEIYKVNTIEEFKEIVDTSKETLAWLKSK